MRASLLSRLRRNPMAKTHTIEIMAKAYPTDTVVAKGDTVEWINKMPMSHTVTADDGSFDSGAFGEDESFSQLFNTTGTISYHCSIHSVMKGKVTVT
jgi:plastocyanin